jgi:hypothetical protein
VCEQRVRTQSARANTRRPTQHLSCAPLARSCTARVCDLMCACYSGYATSHEISPDSLPGRMRGLPCSSGSSGTCACHQRVRTNTHTQCVSACLDFSCECFRLVFSVNVVDLCANTRERHLHTQSGCAHKVSERQPFNTVTGRAHLRARL